jgi:exosortase B
MMTNLMFDHKNKIECWIVIAFVTFISFSQTIYNLFVNIWSKDDQAYGPILFVLSIWLFYVKRSQIIFRKNRSFSLTCSVGLIYAFCLIINVIGISQSFIQLEVIALPIFFLATIRYWGADGQIKILAAPIIFLFLMTPLPASIVDVVTQPMKIAVSWAAEDVLYKLGFPIAREGVILQIGQYKLLVADACSGLKSLFSLEAFGIAYLMIVKSTSVLRNCILAAFIIPISFISNTIRIVILALLTYFEGEEVAQGFLHQFSGIVLFAVAIVITVVVDKCIQFLAKSKNKSVSVINQHNNITYINVPKAKLCLFVTIFSILSVFGSKIMTPIINADDQFTLTSISIPKINQWTQTSDSLQLIDVNYNTPNEKSSFYDKVISKSYSNGLHNIMLALAYDNKIQQDIKIHQQEICYVAQGFKILDKHTQIVEWNNLKFEIVNLLTKRDNRIEVVSYYIRIGDSVSNSATVMRLLILKEGILSHKILDGMLVRASQVISKESDYHAAINENVNFLHDLIQLNNNKNQYLLTGK